MGKKTSRMPAFLMIAVFAVLTVPRPGSVAQAESASPAKPPNIIFILTDDLGYGDLGAFYQTARNAKGLPAHQTPHLDAMAAEGMRLTDHYCPAPVCAPSRASFLLGVNQGHANVRNNQFDKALEDNYTVASVLKSAGYQTAAIGKWGLQGESEDGKRAKDEPRIIPPNWPAHPLNRGFDDYYGYIRHRDGHEHYPKEAPYSTPKQVWENRKEVSADLDKCYTAELFTARAKRWITEQKQAESGKPFFLYLAYDTPHAVCELPTQAYPPGGGLTGGLQWLGTPGHMINTASGKIDSWVHPDYANAVWDDDQNPATPAVPWPDVDKRYATSVRRIDDCVGDLIQLLKDLKIDEQTLVVFTSDNGVSMESYLKQPWNPTFFGSYGPFDGIKRDCWEGGVRVPTIARWPGHIVKGGVSGLPSSLVDWLATFADAADLAPPAKSDGVSLLPTLTGAGDQREPLVYIEYFVAGKTPNYQQFEPAHRDRVRKQMQALRIGDYMCVRYDIKAPSDDFEIYNVAKDPKQSNNLAGQTDLADLQRQAKERVLQVRRPEPTAERPYDKALVPAVTAAGAKPGVRWEAYAGSFTWVPQFQQIKPTSSGRANDVLLSVWPLKQSDGICYSGYIEVPADGAYTLSLTTDAAAILRIHDALVIDADYKHQPGQKMEGSIELKAGLHPFRLACVQRGGAPKQLELEWKKAGETEPVVIRYLAD